MNPCKSTDCFRTQIPIFHGSQQFERTVILGIPQMIKIFIRCYPQIHNATVKLRFICNVLHLPYTYHSLYIPASITTSDLNFIMVQTGCISYNSSLIPFFQSVYIQTGCRLEIEFRLPSSDKSR